ncbi:endonuclease/exonuclease/phosphatase family protein [Flavobacterium luminosum]|uniref:Endonuclease/exonuclease/phosphatase family protein n=1 Tax=Flavobacterium luminosum TaxID=2949086 RepID=A0ABT0TL01_9FLAO|nr:endonuclease/exonuclease/phosphatase family protein [Flavobacterium sp. HXWNR70]MCL9807764.1 endonuclease/exonuclease/phosphatase family protein [Flavobacterium sp. HXWNR70]
MKKLSWFNKIIFFFNAVVTVLTFVAYLLPFLAPKWFPFLSVLTLFLPFFIIVNVLFFLYWLVQIKRQLALSGLVLILGITFINKYYKFSGKELPTSDKDFLVMSYNVRLMNLFNWIPKENVAEDILEFVNEKNPDVLCIQEYSTSASAKIDLKIYPYRSIFMSGDKIKTGNAIFSKFPIVDEGKIDFPKSNNNATFADVKIGKDIVRFYNIHLESLKISPDVKDLSYNVDSIKSKDSKLIVKRISDGFTKQQQQAEIIMEHKKDCKYPMMVCGDMNNSAFSYVYRVIKGNMQDSFEEAGIGFGKTYNFKHYPARIDYIFADTKMKVKSFESFSDFIKSDHMPIMARVTIK